MFDSRHQYMADSDEERQFTIVDNLFRNYDICLADEDGLALIYCLTCDDVVAEIEYENVIDLNDMDLYELIVDKHRPID